MAIINDFAKPPTCCAYCSQPFKQKENHRFAWRSTSGKLYCSEFCAGDEEEAASRALSDSNRPYAVPS
jgi:hypothetical protein